MTNDDTLLKKFKKQPKNNWVSEESVELETLKKSTLLISRIVFKGEDPEKRCIAIEKNRKRVAFDIEMVPVIIAALRKICPEKFVPEEFRGSY